MTGLVLLLIWNGWGMTAGAASLLSVPPQHPTHTHTQVASPHFPPPSFSFLSPFNPFSFITPPQGGVPSPPFFYPATRPPHAR